MMRFCFARKFAGCAVWMLALLLAGCGGNSLSSSPNGNGGGPVMPSAANEQPLTVDAGPASFVNSLFTTVTVCTPGGATCQNVDHVLVDTGSSGLRLMASVLQSSLVLPQQTDGGGNPVAECAQFADGFTWGPLKIADVKISGEQAASVPIQVIGDPAYAVIPNECVNSGPSENSVTSFGANGVLGVGVFEEDCGASCLSDGNGFYYRCPCQDVTQSTALELARQTQNPVATFANDNNGIIIDLPDVPASGAASINGSLIFGIDTQSNNTLASAQVFKVTPGTGTFITTYNGRQYASSLIDSGSSVNFFNDAGIPACDQNDAYAPGFYCPTPAMMLSADVQGTDGVSATLAFSVANAHDLFSNNPGHWAFDNLGAPDIIPGGFIWGLPAFMGRKVFTAIEGRNTSAGAGPYFAF